MMEKYILEGKTPVKCNDLIEWATWFENSRDKRHVAYTELPGNINVSTVFLAIDHAWRGEKPILFETMIFGGEHSEYCERYSTWEEAEAGHRRAIELVFAV